MEMKSPILVLHGDKDVREKKVFTLFHAFVP
jgi:hypothetical protein